LQALYSRRLNMMDKKMTMLNGLPSRSRGKRLIYRILIYIIGLLILAFGVVFSINSDLGVSPVSSLPLIISLISSINMGVSVTIVFLSFILIQIVMLRKEFKWINLSQIIFSSIFGYFVDFAKSVLGGFRIPTYAGQLCMMGIGIALVALGVAVYIEAGLVNMPMEGLISAVVYKAPKIAFHNAKVALDCTVVALSIALSFIFLGELRGVREGTVICAVFVGKLMPVMKKMIMPVVGRIGL